MQIRIIIKLFIHTNWQNIDCDINYIIDCNSFGFFMYKHEPIILDK